MGDRRRLSDGEIRDALADLDGWEGDGEALHRTLQLGDFATAVAFIVRLGFVAEKLNHHPELTNVYGEVGLRLTTHDAGGVTSFDVELARAADAIAASMGR